VEYFRVEQIPGGAEQDPFGTPIEREVFQSGQQPTTTLR
jgi:hypothetical protein